MMIYTFYSYKGGVGRTMALANIAELFYQAGLKVLMVDWDLEAPGLERFFPRIIEEVLDKPGVMDMLLGYREQMAQDLRVPENEDLPFEKPDRFIVDVKPGVLGKGKLWLLSPGRRSREHFADYAHAVRTFDWQDFYQNWEGELYFEWLRQQFEQTADVVLIDSRTGVTEMGGVCTYQLADVVIMFCAPNQQSMEGTYKMACDFKSPKVRDLRRGRPLDILIVPARIERAESDLLDEFQKDFRDRFKDLAPKEKGIDIQRLWQLNIPYVPKYAFTEAVATRESDLASAEDMAIAFYRLSEEIKRFMPDQLARQVERVPQRFLEPVQQLDAPLSSLRRIMVFVTSPRDVMPEREAVRQVIEELNKIWGARKGIVLGLLDWHEHVTPWLDKYPERTLLEQLPVRSWDLFIGIIWSRFGTLTGDSRPGTGSFRSGTEQEFVLAYECYRTFGKPKILFYRCMRPIPADDLDSDQYKAVQKFFGEFERGGEYFGLYRRYETVEEFTDLVRRHLLSALMDFEEEKIPTLPSIDAPKGGLAQWLSTVGLSGNPFSRRQADADDNLPRYFHLFIPYFDELLGITGGPLHTAIVFGEQGSGKSALRQMMGHYASRLPDGRSVLAIPYTDFALLAEKADRGKRITPRDHVEQIIKIGVRTLAQAIRGGDVSLSSSATEDDRLELWKYISNFESSLSRPQWRLLSNLLETESSPSTDDMPLPESYVEMFYGFCNAVRIFGYETVWVLVDRIDEDPLTAGDTNLALQILTPLLTDLRLVEPPNGLAAFRFFLDTSFKDLLKADSAVRIRDRFASYTLEWQKEDLLALIEKRMEVFSSPGHKPYTRLGELSEVDDLDSILVARSHRNPRNLIMLCEFVISEHCRLPVSDDNLMLTREDLKRALRRFEETVDDKEVVAKPPFSPVDSSPTPLAVMIVRYRDEQDMTRKLNYAYYLTQCILQFVGCCMLSLYWHSTERESAIDQKLRELVGAVGNPPSLGHWQDLINRVARINTTANHSLMSAFAIFAKSKVVRTNLGKLMQMRNAFAHGRTGIDEHQMLYQLQEVDAKLDEVLDALEPLGKLALLTIEGHDVNENRQLVHQVQVHQGNVRVPEKQSMRIAMNFKRGDVLLHDWESMTTVPLSPFIVFEPMPGSDNAPNNRDLWVFDQLVASNRDGQFTVQYVSFVSSTTAHFDKYVTELEKLGFVARSSG